VCLDVSAVSGRRALHATRSSQGVENVLPDALLRPAVEAVVDRRIGAVDPRAVAPSRARAHHSHDPRDDPTVIHAMCAPPTHQQIQLDPKPPILAQPIQIPPHDPPPDPQKVNHARSTLGVPLIACRT
jgi:hypothetical protein